LKTQGAGYSERKKYLRHVAGGGKFRHDLIEKLAEHDEGLMDKYVHNHKVSIEE